MAIGAEKHGMDMTKGKGGARRDFPFSTATPADERDSITGDRL